MGRHGAIVLSMLVLFAVGVAAFGLAGTLVASYDIRVSLDTDADTLVGTQTVLITNDSQQAVSEIPFLLIANWGAEANPYLHPALTDPQYTAGFDPTWTNISRVTDAEDVALPFRLEPTPAVLQTFSLDAGLLVVELLTSLAPGDSLTLHVDFETKLARAMGMDNCVYKDTYVWRFGWNPVVVDPATDEAAFQLPAATYRVQLTVPEDFAAFGGADHQQELGTASGLKTIELSNDRVTRSVPLIIGPELNFVSTEWNGVVIHAVYRPGGESYARIALSHAAEILAYHSERFGPFSNKRLIIAENPTPGFFGLAADGMVLVGSSAVRLKDMPALGAYDRLNEYLLAHELAHMWWGIGIGTDFNAENWISEGFAEYLSISYFEEQHGAFDANLLSHLQPGLVEDILSDAIGYLNLRQHMSELPYLALLQMGFDEPIIQPRTESKYLNGLTIRTYSKGYLVLRALEAIIGQDAMGQLLLEAHETWNGKLLTVEALRSLAESASATDLSDFFDAWLFGSARFDASIAGFDTTQTESGYSSTLQLAGLDPLFPIVVEATLEDGTHSQITLWTTDPASPVQPLETASPVVSIAIDPDEMLPDGNRFNNHWPRKILVAHPFRSDDAPEIGMPLDAYVITILGPSISGQFRNEHAWSLMVLPSFDPNVDWTTFDIAQFGNRLDVVGTFAAQLGRNLDVRFTGWISALDPTTGTGELEMALTARVLGFTHPETGNAGQYWYPSWQSELTLGALGELSHPIPYLSFAITRDDLLPLYMANTLTLQLGIPGFAAEPFGTIEWRGIKRFRLAPLLYVDASVSVGETLFQDLPNEFLFGMDELRSFKFLPMGHHRLFASIEIVFPPLIRDSGYAIFNWTRLDSITPSAFIRGGRIQANCDFVCEPGTRVELGAKLVFTLPGFLGPAIQIGIGYAHPLVGIRGDGQLFLTLGESF